MDTRAALARLDTLADLARWHDLLEASPPLLAAGEPDAWVLHLTALNALARHEQGWDEAQIALACWPTEPRLHLQAGFAALDMDLPARAAQVARDGLALAADWPPLLLLLAYALLAQDDARAAQVPAARLLAIAPDELSSHLLQTHIHSSLGRFGQARQHSQTALRLAPSAASAHVLAGALALNRSRRQALAHWRSALRARPREDELHHLYQRLRLVWWADVGLAALTVAALVATAQWPWLTAPLGAWAIVCALVAVLLAGARLARHVHAPSIWAYVLSAALALGWHTPNSRLRLGQPLDALDLMAYAVSVVSLAVLLWLALHVTQLLLVDTLKTLARAARLLWQACRSDTARAVLDEQLRSRPLRVSLLAGLGAAVPALPPIPPALYALHAALLLPLWLWGVALWQRGPGRLPLSVTFALVGFPLMLSVVFTLSASAASAWCQMGLALAYGLYASLITATLQRVL